MKKYLTISMIVVVGFLLIDGCGNQQDEMTTGMITGIISDSTGMRLDSALVITDPATVNMYTDDTGAYQIPDIEPDDYTVIASRRTYIPGSVEISVTAGDITTANISLIQNARCVLAEMLTTACHCSDVARNEIYIIKSSLDGVLAYVEYHASVDPGFQTYDPFATEESEARRLFLQADTFEIGEWMYFNGTILHYAPGAYQQTIDSLLGIFSPLAMEVTGSYSSSTGTGTIDVTITAVDNIGYSDLVVSFAVYERGPIDYSPSGPCVVPFRYILVEMPAHEPLDISYGQTVSMSKSFAVPDTIGGILPPYHRVDFTNIGVSVFVQSTGSREVLQASNIGF